MTAGRKGYTKATIRQLIPLLYELRGGYYPPKGKESGYTDIGIVKKGYNTTAGFASPCETAAELDSRIEHCGEDGLWLELAQAKPEDYFHVVQHIKNAMKLSFKEVDDRINTALDYMEGECPRWHDCPGAGKCPNCNGCKNFKKCTKLPVWGITYTAFKEKREAEKARVDSLVARKGFRQRVAGAFRYIKGHKKQAVSLNLPPKGVYIMRPDGWGDINSTIPLPDNYPPNQGWKRVMTTEEKRIFEAGADAYEKGIKERGVKVDHKTKGNAITLYLERSLLTKNRLKHGTWVFIPDE